MRRALSLALAAVLAARSVKTFAIQFGEASPAELQRIVQATAGAKFDANQTSLAAAFKEIRGYQ